MKLQGKSSQRCAYVDTTRNPFFRSNCAGLSYTDPPSQDSSSENERGGWAKLMDLGSLSGLFGGGDGRCKIDLKPTSNFHNNPVHLVNIPSSDPGLAIAPVWAGSEKARPSWLCGLVLTSASVSCRRPRPCFSPVGAYNARKTLFSDPRLNSLVPHDNFTG
jgi:hypothetical protein